MRTFLAKHVTATTGTLSSTASSGSATRDELKGYRYYWATHQASDASAQRTGT